MDCVRLASDERPETVWELRVLGSWVERMRGLLGTGPKVSAVMLPRCRSIHTYGMRYPIDVAFVARDGEVLRVVRSLGVGSCAAHPDAFCVLERPSREGDWVREGERLWAVSLSVGMV